MKWKHAERCNVFARLLNLLRYCGAKEAFGEVKCWRKWHGSVSLPLAACECFLTSLKSGASRLTKPGRRRYLTQRGDFGPVPTHRLRSMQQRACTTCGSHS